MKTVFVTFVNKKVESEFYLLKEGRFEERGQYSLLFKAFQNIKTDPSCGTKLPNRLWPKIYFKKYGHMNNLWKYDLPSGQRLIYTLAENDLQIVCFVFEWLSHKDYEKRFKY